MVMEFAMIPVTKTAIHALTVNALLINHAMRVVSVLIRAVMKRAVLMRTAIIAPQTVAVLLKNRAIQMDHVETLAETRFVMVLEMKIANPAPRIVSACLMSRATQMAPAVSHVVILSVNLGVGKTVILVPRTVHALLKNLAMLVEYAVIPVEMACVNRAVEKTATFAKTTVRVKNHSSVDRRHGTVSLPACATFALEWQTKRAIEMAMVHQIVWMSAQTTQLRCWNHLVDAMMHVEPINTVHGSSRRGLGIKTKTCGKEGTSLFFLGVGVSRVDRFSQCM